jgi:hypothetical protein
MWLMLVVSDASCLRSQLYWDTPIEHSYKKGHSHIATHPESYLQLKHGLAPAGDDDFYAEFWSVMMCLMLVVSSLGYIAAHS